MTIFKRILDYLFWLAIAMICAFGYIFLLLGEFPDGTHWFDVFSLIFYRLVYMYVGFSLGGLIAFIYFLLDGFYLRKKLKSTMKSFFVKLLMIIAITICIGALHYFLEKVIDVI